jgi:hypothetical protein
MTALNVGLLASSIVISVIAAMVWFGGSSDLILVAYYTLTT